MADKNKEKYTQKIKSEAAKMGFAACGIAKASFLEKDAAHLEKWLSAGMHGSMKYMENHFDKRLDPRLIVDNAQSVIVFLYNYYTDEIDFNSLLKISKYALGKDYHFVLKQKLYQLLEKIRNFTGDFNARVFVDSAPILERSWATKAGLGWQGKNSCLIMPRQGSFFFIAEIITDLALNYQNQYAKNHCGKCKKCIDACPTNAIVSPGMIDSRRCISYLTIELKKEIPEAFKQKMNGYIFGCDICMNVCPWNKFAKNHTEPAFLPQPELMKMTKNDWLTLSKPMFKRLFKKSALERTKYEALMRNIQFVANQNIRHIE